MRILKLLMLFPFWLTGCSTAPTRNHSAAAIAYTIESTTYAGKSALNITASFEGAADGQTEIELPSEWASEREYYNDLKYLKVVGPGSITAGDKPSNVVVHHPLGKTVEINYVLTAVPATGDNPYRALIEDKYFHFVGFNAFAYPKQALDKPITISLNWKSFPSNFSIANSFGVGKSHQEIVENLDRLREAIYVGGDFRILNESINGQPLVIAIRGQWNFADSEFASVVHRVVQTERDFWQDHNYPYFLITLVPNGRSCCDNGGTALTNSFATFASPDFKIDHSLIHLLSHELFHNWNGRLLQPVAPEELLYWFSEGFTDYYASVLSYRSGLITLDDLVAQINEVLYDHYFSPARNEPNDLIRKDFWKSQDVEKLPYRRGEIAAWNWNAMIRSSSGGHSLDDFMKDMVAETRMNHKDISFETIIRIMNPYIKSDSFKTDVDRYIIAGQTMPLRPDILGNCVEVKSIKIGKFEHGYDSKKTYEAKIVTGVIKNSPAYQAGLRNGQRLLDRKMVSPPFEKSRVKVSDSHGERWIEFLPVSKTKIVVPFLVKRRDGCKI